MKWLLGLFFLVRFGGAEPSDPVQSYLDNFNRDYLRISNEMNHAQWAWETNTTVHNADESAKAEAALSTFTDQAARDLKSTIIKGTLGNRSGWTTQQQRHINKILDVGMNLTGADAIRKSQMMSNMTGAYSSNTVCAWIDGRPDCPVQWSFHPDIYEFMAKSRDYDGLLYIWDQWRAKNAPNQAVYKEFVKLVNKGAVQGGAKDTGDLWRSNYESGNFSEQIQELYYEILPMYEQLHAYVRGKLRNQYPGKWTDDTIPAHILGGMWGGMWENIYDITGPFAGQTPLDVTAAMVDQNYTALKMFQAADNFFQSIGLPAMNPSFWHRSRITKPKRTPVNFVCSASAWDFLDANDYRIKMCTSVTMDNLIVIHHEMGHVQYYMHYSKLPGLFRAGANPGFHEAIGDTIAKVVSTPGHLQAIGLLSNYTPSNAQDINYLYKQALANVAFLPYAYVMDLWRWNVFNGTFDSTNWNKEWWNLRTKLQGLSSPNERPADAFDPASKTHINSNTPYIRYFVSFIVQFQFYQSMCRKAGHSGPLNQCDFYNNKAAGKALGDMLALGSSQPWEVAMEKITGQSQMSAEPLKAYFQPLTDWLGMKNKESGECFGWGTDYPPEILRTLPSPRCPPKSNIEIEMEELDISGAAKLGTSSLLLTTLVLLRLY